MTAALPYIAAGVLAFAVLAYVVLDGFDLGVGILFPLEPEAADRDVMVNTVAPVWDGNETWLILGGGGLFALFPTAYAVLMPALYPAIIAMLLALIFRGVAFEFRHRAESRTGRRAWDAAFWLGSLGAAFCQGLSLGGLMQGVRVEGGQYAGGWWDWLTAFTLFCGVAVVIGYGLLGSTWLVWRTEGALQARCRRYAIRFAVLTLLCIVIASLWTPFQHPSYAAHWFRWPEIVLTSPVPLLVALAAWGLWRGLRGGGEVGPFLCALAWFVLCFAGLGISLFPFIVPPQLTIAGAAAPPASQGFLLIGAAVLVPIILAYTGVAYWLFRGKVSAADSHYH